MKIKILLDLFLLFSFGCSVLSAQEPVWDDTRRVDWPEEFRVVEIPSTADGTLQRAYFYPSTGGRPRPLIVSLHTWSGDYAQRDPLVAEILARDYNYIHPDFRGANRTPQATGSQLVIRDIEDAIRYALDHSDSDPQDVHIIGVSGGGMATLLCYMQITYPVRSFSAWAPISDLEDWYWESVGRQQKYAQDILDSVSPGGNFDPEEARRRSALAMPVPFNLRAGSELFIYTGIHDGYTGSVPITHSLKMFNHVALQWKGHSMLAVEPPLVTEAEMLELVTRRTNPLSGPDIAINDRAVYLQRDYSPVYLTVFDGGHEMLPRGFSMIPFVNQTTDLKRNIFTIGDSNGDNPGGWVDQLRAALPECDIFNISQGGRTIGFDNNGREELNALRQIDSYLVRAAEHIGGGEYDYIILCLGTNDTKAEFAEMQDQVAVNFERLLDKMQDHSLIRRSHPQLVFVTPPPMGVGDTEEKYAGGNDRLAVLVPLLSDIASRKGFSVVDVYHPLQRVFRTYAPDGVHMIPEGQVIVAQRILDCIENLEKKRK